MRHDAIEIDSGSMSRGPLDSYGPPPEEEPSMGPPGAGRQNWAQWIQIAITSALAMLLINQLAELNAVNRKMADLHKRMELIENVRLTDKTPLMEEQQQRIIKRLLQLESAVRELTLERQVDSGSGSGAPAFQLTPPPPSR
jgi:hypothetical protein